jgi:arginine deiminase
VSHTHGVDSEIGQLRAVLVHRPGAELRRITPRTRGRLMFDGVPWVGRAQEEHDAFAQILRDRGVEVLYVAELLQDTLEYQLAREDAIASALADRRLGGELREQVRGYLEGLDPEGLAQVLVAGLAPDELSTGRGVVFQLLDRHDFVIDPLPNLVFTRDSSVWIGDHVAVTSLASGSRGRESALLDVVYSHHPRFAGTKRLYGPADEDLAGGDVLLLAPGVIAAGVGEHTAPAGVERLARSVFAAGLAHTLLAVLLDQGAGPRLDAVRRDGLRRDTAGRDGLRLDPAHLDTLCTVIDQDTIVMRPALAYTLRACRVTPLADGLRVSRPQPFLEAAAQAMGVGQLHVIDTGLDPRGGRRDQWDDGSNALVLGQRVVICHERNVETNARLEAAGIEVIRVPGSELGRARGGPRGMSCAVGRDPAAEPDTVAGPGAEPRLAVRHDDELAPSPRAVPAMSNPPGHAAGDQQLMPAR